MLCGYYSLTCSFRAESVFVSMISFIPSYYPFDFMRVQFPFKICLTITNNLKDKLLSWQQQAVLREISRSQLYVACTSVRSLSSMVFLEPHRKILYKEIHFIIHKFTKLNQSRFQSDCTCCNAHLRFQQVYKSLQIIDNFCPKAIIIS